MHGLTRVLLWIFAIALAAVGWPTVSSATPIAYFGGPDPSKLSLNYASAARTSFTSALSAFGVEDLEDNTGSSPTLAFSGSSITATTGFSNGVNTMTAYAVSGKKFIWDTEGEDDWLQFSEPVTAFGSYIVQSGDGSSTPQPPAEPTPTNVLTLHLQNTISGASKDVFIANLGPDWPFYNVIFVGVTDTEPFDRVSIGESYDHDGLLFDDLLAGFVAPPPPFPGDADGNRFVDFADLGILLNHYNQAGGFSQGDFDETQFVDFADLGILLNHYNQAAPAATAAAPVPEPHSLLLCGLVVLCLWGARGYTMGRAIQ